MYTGDTQSFTVTFICQTGTCPQNANYSWSLSRNLGTLSSTTGPSVDFRAGNSAGSLTLSVKVTYGGKSIVFSSTIMIVAGPSTLGSQSLSPLDWGLIAIAAAAVVAVVVMLFLFRKKGNTTTHYTNAQPAPPGPAPPPPPEMSGPWSGSAPAPPKP
jgi:hypothetical protein